MPVRSSSPRFSLFVLLVLGLVFSLPLFSQTENATISGTITDQTGAIVTGAAVKLTNVETGITATTNSNNSGLYVFPTVRPSHYRMTVDKAGFRQVILTDLTVNVQDTLGRNFSLKIGAVGESVTVNGGDVGTINTESATVSTVVDQQFVENMPLNGRSFQELMYLTPGATFLVSGGAAVNAGFYENGQRSTSNYFMIDGVSANIGTTGIGNAPGATNGTSLGTDANGNTNGLVSLDAMQEFRIQTSTFAPEFGRTVGGQVSITTKSGANHWHGTAFEDLRNNIFDARNTFNVAPAPKPAEHMNDFGGTFSGPVWKDHTFFFFSFEKDILLQPQVAQGYFLTAASRAFVAPVWQPYLNASPLLPASAPTVDPYSGNPVTCVASATQPCFQELNVGQSYPSDSTAISLRLDQNLTKKLTVFGRIDHAPSYSTYINFNTTYPSNTDNDTVTVGATYAISPTMANDLRFNWSRSHNYGTGITTSAYGATVPPAGTPWYPAGSGWNNGNASSTIGFGAGDFGGSVVQVSAGGVGGQSQRQWNIVDSLSKVVGAHQLKFGVDWRRMQPTRGYGSFFFSSSGTWADLVNGMLDETAFTAQKELTYSTDNWSFYGQDTWKLTPKLTLTYGLRWDINPAPVTRTSGLPVYAIDGVFNSNPLALVQRPLWNTQWNAFAPRIGAAYLLTPKTVLRGGFGLFNDLGFGSVLGNGEPYSANALTYLVDNNGNGTIPFNLNLPSSDPNYFAYQVPPFTTTLDSSSLGIQAVDPNLKTPFSLQWNAAVERQLGKNQTITASYVGQDGRRLMYGTNVNMNGAYGFANMNKGYSHYNSLQFSYMARMTHGLQAMVNYTRSRSSDVTSFIISPIAYVNVQSIVLPPQSPSDFDIPNNIQAMVSYSVPKPTWGGTAAKWILGGWGLDGLYHYQSGFPISVTVSAPVPGILPNPYALLKADRVPGQPIWIPAPAGSYQPAGKVLNPNAFAYPANGEYWGTSGRNQIRSPYGMNETDMSLRRQFNITERVKLSLRMQFFNLFNHPMFLPSLAPSTFWGRCSTPTTCRQFPAFGKLHPGGTLNQSGYGQTGVYAPGNNRTGQVSLKLTF